MKPPPPFPATPTALSMRGLLLPFPPSALRQRPSPRSRRDRGRGALLLLLAGLLLGLALAPLSTPPSPSLPAAASLPLAPMISGLGGGATRPLSASSNLSATWFSIGTNAPPIANASALLYPDAAPPFPLLFGGSGDCNASYCNETLGYLYYEGSSSWEDLSPAHSPSPRAHASFAWDPALNAAVLFGGEGTEGFLNDTWTYTLASGWTQLHPPVSPSPRAGAAFAFDPATNQTLLFGGTGPHGALNDTWAFADGLWTPLDLPRAPSPRSGALFVSGSPPGELVLFGGTGPGGYLNDTWAFQDSAWAPLAPARSPSPRAEAETAVTAGGYPLLFGGVGPGGFLNDTWVLKGGTWQPVANVPPTEVGATPGPVAGGLLVPDLLVGPNYFLLFGGYGSSGTQDEQWTLFTPFGGLPPNTHPLVVGLESSTRGGLVPLSVTFTAEVSGGEPPYQYGWDFGDGSQATGSAAEVHSYDATGSYTVRVTVTDAQGETAVASVEVTVHGVPFDPLSVLGGPVVWGLLAVVGLLGVWGVRGGTRELRERRRIRAGVGHAPTRGERTAAAVGAWARTGEWRELGGELRRIWLPAARKREGANPWLFGTWLARRLLMIVPQLLLGVTLLYTFTVVLAQSPSTVGQVTGWGFLQGLSGFTTQLFTGQWGQVFLSANAEVPVTTVISYYLPYSIELAAFSLLFTSLVSYPLGLLSGWRRGRGVDNTTRLLAAFGAFFPLVVLALYVTDFLYGPFLHAFGDPLFGSLPSGVWFSQHYGGYPSWVGYFGQTSPTGFPLMDAALHQAWNVEALLWLKIGVQSAVIGLIYASLYLRYARLATAGTVDPVTTSSARSRGLSDRTLLWRHTSRQVLPVYVYTFGNTFALFLLIQSLGEWFFQDTGMGQFLIYEVVSASPSNPSLTGPPLLAVLAFLVLAVILTVNLLADALSRYLDPRLGWGRRSQ